MSKSKDNDGEYIDTCSHVHTTQNSLIIVSSSAALAKTKVVKYLIDTNRPYSTSKSINTYIVNEIFVVHHACGNIEYREIYI